MAPMTAAPTIARTPDWLLRRTAAPVEEVLLEADEVPVLVTGTDEVTVEVTVAVVPVRVVEAPLLVVVVAALPVAERL